MKIVLFTGIEFLFPSVEKDVTLVGEFDHILVIDSLKLIIYCELKATFSRSLAKRKRQFERFKDLLESHFPIGEGWRLATAYGFSRMPDNGRLCSSCGDNVFFVNQASSLRKWLDQIFRIKSPSVQEKGE